jgi:hypothetical protein
VIRIDAVYGKKRRDILQSSDPATTSPVAHRSHAA